MNTKQDSCNPSHFLCFHVIWDELRTTSDECWICPILKLFEVQPVLSSSGKWQFTEVLPWAYELLLIALQWWICTQPTPPSSLQARGCLCSTEAMAKGTVQGKKGMNLQSSEQRQILAAGNEGFHPHLLCSFKLYWCEPAQMWWASTCKWLHTRMVKAGQRVQLAEDALRGGNAATWELRPCFPCRRGQVTALCHCRLKTFLTHANVVTRFLSACEAISCQFLICTTSLEEVTWQATVRQENLYWS